MVTVIDHQFELDFTTQQKLNLYPFFHLENCFCNWNILLYNLTTEDYLDRTELDLSKEYTHLLFYAKNSRVYCTEVLFFKWLKCRQNFSLYTNIYDNVKYTCMRQCSKVLGTNSETLPKIMSDVREFDQILKRRLAENILLH